MRLVSLEYEKVSQRLVSQANFIELFGLVRLVSLELENVCLRLVSQELKNGLVRLVSQGQKNSV